MESSHELAWPHWWSLLGDKLQFAPLATDVPAEQLEAELGEVNDFIERSSMLSYGTHSELLRVRVDGVPVSFKQATSAMLVRKQQLELALASRAAEEQVAKVKERLEHRVSDLDVREELSELLTEAQRRQSELDALLKEAGAVQDREIRNVEIQERRWKMRWSLLQREPVAVLVGALLLVVFSGVVVVAMWTHTDVPEVVINMLLLILGFFFGQSSSGKGNSSE
ncbi:hypothetical protein ABZ319_23675 [Nocardia sp. NPDC005978]|uniref:hypothetical protein n=1 Tax=Nocardia sp. NPDC005978 TaxID=3156725 RepID=UPI0033B67E09